MAIRFRFICCYLLIAFVATSAFASGGTATNKSNPFFTTKAKTAVVSGVAYYYKFEAEDSLNNIISFSIASKPSWLSFNNTEHSVSGMTAKAGQYFVDIVAYNQTDSMHQRFMLTVTNKKTTSILCLGNSLTNGTNKYNSYRRALWQMLHKANYNFDFIGSWDKHHMGAEMPNPDFDMDHDGHSGWRIDDIFNPPSWDSARGNISHWLQSYTADIVLIELGTNDVFQCRTVADMIADLEKLTMLLREKNSKVKILLAQIPPLGKEWATKKLCGDSTDYDHAIRNLNQAFGDFAKNNSKKESPIEIVDQYSGVNTDLEMYDDIHPNEAGEKIMAERWYNSLKKYLHKLQ